MPESTSTVSFRKQDSIGINDAEDDKYFLLNCFVDTGDYNVVRDFESARCLLLGRTGMGKTALITKLIDDDAEKNNVIVINPEALAMHHISNSTIVRYMYELGIDLNTFFKLLWRHAVCVEILDHHFKLASEHDTENLLDNLRYRFKKDNVHHLRALNYLEEWRHTFWKKTDDFVTEMISKKETELSGGIKAGVSGLSASVGANDKLTEEQRSVLRNRAQTIVDEVQMREVTDLLSMLDEVIDDQQKQYYIVIDKLDEGWVDDRLRYRLIKALIETVRDLNRFHNLKPVVALRADLLDHVFDVTQDRGFQAEKYSSLYLYVRWTKTQLVDLIDQRIAFLLKDRYRRKDLTHLDILPPTIDGKPAIDYILERTLMRPRDIIEFFNKIIAEATEHKTVTEQMVLDAGRIYSRERLDSVYYEWYADYPHLKRWVEVLRQKGRDFFVGSIDQERISQMCLEYAVNYPGDIDQNNDRLYAMARDVSEGKLNVELFIKSLVYIFYTTGLVGLQVTGFEQPIWSYDLQKKISLDDVDAKTMVHIHLCFRSALNIS